MAKNILMICYYYPPLLDVGCKRSIAFSKYFKKYGWAPFVLSVRNPDKTYCLMGNDHPPEGVPTKYSYSIINPYLIAGKLNGLFTRIMRTFNVKIRRNYFYDLLCIPDLFWGWIPLTVFSGLKIVPPKNIDVIYVSCSPFSSAFIGIFLKMLTRKPLIIDFRDAFALNLKTLGNSYSNRPFRKQIDLLLEGIMLKWTDLFLVTTEEMRELYIMTYRQHASKIYTIYNGFEADTLSKIDPYVAKYSKFTIMYSGNFYFGLNGSYVFFKALAFLKKKKQISEQNFQFLYYGGEVEHFNQIAKCLKIEDLVIARSYISHQMLLNNIRKSHLCLIRIMKPMISTKLFECIALNACLLAIIPSGEAERLIKKFSPASYVINNPSPEEVAEAILDAIHKHSKELISHNHIVEFLEHFSREKLTLKLMKLLDENIA
jgi:glycosyltransferase involved in cell wall biosynthesis